MVYKINIEGIELRASHGCYDTEQTVGGNYLVDVFLTVDGAVEADDVAGTVNYVEVYEVVRGEMSHPSRIIENAAWRISEAIRAEFPQVLDVRVTLSKLAPPMGGKAAKVTVEVNSNGYEA